VCHQIDIRRCTRWVIRWVNVGPFILSISSHYLWIDFQYFFIGFVLTTEKDELVIKHTKLLLMWNNTIVRYWSSTLEFSFHCFVARSTFVHIITYNNFISSSCLFYLCIQYLSLSAVTKWLVNIRVVPTIYFSIGYIYLIIK